MAVFDQKLVDVQIADLAPADVPVVADLFLKCNPEPVHRLLGVGALAEALRERCFGVAPDLVGRVATRTADRQIVAYCLSIPKPADAQTGALLTNRVVLAHLKRRIWTSPGLWGYLAGWIVRRARAKLLKHGGKERIDRVREIAAPGPVEFIAQLGVDPQVRFSNIGFDLMLDMERQALGRGAAAVCGLVYQGNRVAQRMYAAIGWKRASEAPAGGQACDFLCMYKQVSAATVGAAPA